MRATQMKECGLMMDIEKAMSLKSGEWLV